MRIIFAGTPEPAVVALEKLVASPHDVIAVITRPDAPRGRGRTLHPSPVKAVALQHGIPVLTPTTLKAGTSDGTEFRTQLRELAPECIPVVAYGNLIPQDILDMVPHGFINLHFSTLPRWRGAAPVQAAIRAGDTETGVTTFRIDAGLDTGDILRQAPQPIKDTDTADDLLTRLAYQGADVLASTMDDLAAGTATFQPQIGNTTHAEKIMVNDARVDWTWDAPTIDRHIRAVTPAPGAWTMLGEQRIKLRPTTQLFDTPTLPPGSIHVEKHRILVGTGTTPVALSQLQAPGKKMMNATDWARGLTTTEGITFQ